jgi:capsular polysaccharide biosynthesis protein
MELRRYWSIIWRYRWVVLALPFLVGLGASALWLAQPATYTARLKMQLVLAPPQGTGAGGDFFRYDTYYNYLATEYAVDDLAEVMNGNVFADAVAATLRGPDFGLNLDDEDVRGSFTARRTHRVLLVDVKTGDRDRSMAIARAVGLTLARDPLKYFSKGDLVPKQGAAPLVIDAPLEARGDRVQRALNVIIQTVLALFAGLGLAFLLDYLNDRLRDAEGTRAALGLPVLGQIPADGRAGARAWRGAIVDGQRAGRG